MTAKWPLLFALVLGLAATRAAGPAVTIDTASPSGKVSPLFYGLMTEEINHAYDGGLYAELVRNRAFLDDPATPAHWSIVQADGSTATMALDPKEPLNTTIGTSLRLDVTQASTGHAAGITNEGYWGIPVKPNTRYRASFYAKAAPGFTGPIAVSIQSDDGRTIYATKTVTGLTSVWKQYELTLETDKVTPTAKARYVLTVDRPGTVWFSMVSLFPTTFKGQPNGFRPDIMRMMVEMKPKFLRFPGGNYLEGDQIADRFEWKKTIGPLSDRPGHMGIAAGEGRPSGTVQNDVRRGGKRGLVRQVGFLRSALRAIQHGHQGAPSAAQSDLDRRVRAAGGSARPQRQAGRARRALLPDRRGVPENGARAVREVRSQGAGDLRRRVGHLRNAVRAVERSLARRAADAELARCHRRRRVHDPDGEACRHRGDE